MNRKIIHQSLDNFEWNFNFVTEGLTNQHLFVRSYQKGSHLAWLLGHAIKSEKTIVEMVKPNSMPDLPEEFAAKHTSKTLATENPEDFYTLKQYLNFASEIRKGTRLVIDSLTEDELSKTIAEDDSSFMKDGFNGMLFVSQHWFWHLEQIIVVRKHVGLD